MSARASTVVGALLSGIVLAATAAAPVPLATDLRRDSMEAAHSATPLLLLFTLPNCAYCHTVRTNYMAPLVRGDAGQRFIVREIVIDGQVRAAGLDGKPTTHAALALQFKARFGPTVLFVDAQGQTLAPPLIGGDTAGMYGGYLDERLAVSLKRLSDIDNKRKTQ